MAVSPRISKSSYVPSCSIVSAGATVARPKESSALGICDIQSAHRRREDIFCPVYSKDKLHAEINYHNFVVKIYRKLTPPPPPPPPQYILDFRASTLSLQIPRLSHLRHSYMSALHVKRLTCSRCHAPASSNNTETIVRNLPCSSDLNVSVRGKTLYKKPEGESHIKMTGVLVGNFRKAP